MKTIFNKQKKSIVGIMAAMLAFATVITGCQNDFELDLPLAVSSRELSLKETAGSTHVLVYSDGEWTAHLTRNVKWASINKTAGYGNHEIVFSYSANYGISRKVGVVFTKGALNPPSPTKTKSTLRRVFCFGGGAASRAKGPGSGFRLRAGD